MPRLENTETPSGSHASWMRGSTCSTMPRLANSSSTSSGMLRTISTYVRAQRTQHSVARQPADPDQRAEHRGEHEPGDRDAQRVEEALRPARRGPGRSGDIGCRGSRSSRAGRGRRSRSGCSSARRWCGSWSTASRGRRRRRRAPRAGRSSAARGRRARAADVRRRVGAVRDGLGGSSTIPNCSACQRYGGAYISPPSVHSALTPRSRPSGARCALEDLAVVPDLLDDLVGEVDGQAEARIERRRTAVLARHLSAEELLDADVFAGRASRRRWPA